MIAESVFEEGFRIQALEWMISSGGFIGDALLLIITRTMDYLSHSYTVSSFLLIMELVIGLDNSLLMLYLNVLRRVYCPEDEDEETAAVVPLATIEKEEDAEEEGVNRVMKEDEPKSDEPFGEYTVASISELSLTALFYPLGNIYMVIVFLQVAIGLFLFAFCIVNVKGEKSRWDELTEGDKSKLMRGLVSQSQLLKGFCCKQGAYDPCEDGDVKLEDRERMREWRDKVEPRGNCFSRLCIGFCSSLWICVALPSVIFSVLVVGMALK